MIGDEGPYVAMDVPDIWVPRTVPYLRARQVARTGLSDWDDRLVYVGKEDAEMLGFTRDCLCDEVCEMANRCRICGSDEVECACDEPDQEDWDICRAPAWHFRSVER